jgi:hypothetical protein
MENIGLQALKPPNALALATKIWEAEKAKQRHQGKPLSLTVVQPAIVMQLPLWGDTLRILPNEIVRSALFNARNRKQPRTYIKKTDIAVIGAGRITYQGEELRQDDETVWLQLIHMVKERPLGQTVEFTPYSFCKAIDWPICKGSYERLRACLDRMQATALAVYSNRLKENGGKSIAMIPLFEWQGKDEQTLKKYQVQVAPQLVDLFVEDYCTKLEWSQRLALPVGIATWLHSYYASHREPFQIKLDTLKKGAGMTTESPAKVRQLIEKALAKLVEVGFLTSWTITGELVDVKRKA